MTKRELLDLVEDVIVAAVSCSEGNSRTGDADADLNAHHDAFERLLAGIDTLGLPS